jgi:hypothetical protein
MLLRAPIFWDSPNSPRGVCVCVCVCVWGGWGGARTHATSLSKNVLSHYMTQWKNFGPPTTYDFVPMLSNTKLSLRTKKILGN